VQTIRRWRASLGRLAHPQATTLLLTADASGSNITPHQPHGEWNYTITAADTPD
jgi:hypothetical protein